MTVYRRGIDLDTFYNARVSIAAEVAVTATTSATGNSCITTGAFSVENGGTYEITVFTPYLTKGTTNIDVELWDSATLLTSLTGHMAASVAVPGVTIKTFQTLAAGGHNLAVKAFVDAGTGKFGANNGATGNAPNAWLLVQPA